MEKLYGAKVCRPKCKAKDKRVVKGEGSVSHECFKCHSTLIGQNEPPKQC